jgi:hypothetical protein
VRGADSINPFLLSAAEYLHWQDRKVAKQPEQVKPLRKGRVYISRAERGEYAKHSPVKFFQPHSRDHLRVICLIALNQSNSRASIIAPYVMQGK